MELILDDLPAYAAIVRRRLERSESVASRHEKRRNRVVKIVGGRINVLADDRWPALRALVLLRDGALCAKCGSTANLHIDHILPKSKFPELTFDPINLRVLCQPCNWKKATKIDIDIEL